MQLIKKRMFDNNSVVANFISIANALSEEETSQVRQNEITKFLEVFRFEINNLDKQILYAYQALHDVCRNDSFFSDGFFPAHGNPECKRKCRKGDHIQRYLRNVF